MSDDEGLHVNDLFIPSSGFSVSIDTTDVDLSDAVEEYWDTHTMTHTTAAITAASDDTYGDCERCGDDADGIAKYEFAEHRGGPETYAYCQDCAAVMDSKYTIDHVEDGDLGL